MKMILSQAGKSLMSGIALTLVIILMFSVGQFLLIGCASYFNSSETKLTNFYTAYNNEELRLRTNPLTISAFNTYKDLGLLDEFKHYMQNYARILIRGETEGFEQYVFNTHAHATVADFAGTDRCIYNFEEGTGIRDANAIDDAYYTALKTYCITPGVFDKFCLKTAEGRDFSEDTDFVYREDLIVPIVMGYEYRPYYNVGDRFRGHDSFLLKTIPREDPQSQAPLQSVFAMFTFEVVGFLEPGSAILDPDYDSVNPIGLDQYVLMPFVDYTDLIFTADTSDRSDMYTHFIGGRTQGVVVVKKGSESLLAPYYKTIGLDKCNITPLNSPIMIISGIFKLEAKNYFKTLLATAALIVGSATLCLSINMTNKLLSNFKKYAIHQISGGTLADVKWTMVAEEVILMLISNALAFIGAYLFGAQVFTYTKSQIFGVTVASISPVSILFALGVSVLILFFSLLVPFIKINTVEFDTLLRGRE